MSERGFARCPAAGGHSRHLSHRHCTRCWSSHLPPHGLRALPGQWLFSTEPSTAGASPRTLMVKTSTDIRGHNRKKKEKAAPCLGVQALDGLGTFHHPVISGSGDRAPDRMETEGLRGQPSPVGLPLARSLLRRSPAPALPASWPSIASSSVPPP